MTPSYDYGADYNYGPTPDYQDYIEAPKGPEGFAFYLLVLLLYLICPLVVILNLMLFIKIVRTKKISGEPWRWLIAHTSFCMAITSVFAWNRSLTSLYNVPSLVSEPACYFFAYFESATWTMTVVTYILVLTERVHGLRLGIGDGGSFSKKQVILCLVPFWIITAIGSTLPSIIAAISYDYSLFYVHNLLCILKYNANQFTQLLLWLWAFPTFIVVFIGTLVWKGRKTTTDLMKQSIVTPTLALCCTGFLFMVIPLFFHMVDFLFGLMNLLEMYAFNMFNFVYLITFLNDLALPIIWLVTWSRVGDISMKCGKSEDGEHKRLLDKN